MAVLKIMDWEARVWVFLEKMVWTTIIERGGVSCRYLGLLSDDPSCSFFSYSIAIILNMIFKHEMLFLQSIEVS